MQDESSQAPLMNAHIQRALSHPKRSEILGYLMRKKDGTSEGELAGELGIGIRLVEYHLKVLHDADLIARLEDGVGQADANGSYVAASAC